MRKAWGSVTANAVRSSCPPDICRAVALRNGPVATRPYEPSITCLRSKRERNGEGGNSARTSLRYGTSSSRVTRRLNRDVTGSTLRRLWSEKAAGKTLGRTVDSGAGAIPAPERAIYFTLAKSASNCMVCPSCNVTITVVLAFGSNDSYPNRAVKRDR